MTSTPLVCCWSAKGGTGTSVFAAMMALCAAHTGDTVLVDAAGDQHAIFGTQAPEVGFVQWAGGGDEVPADALARLAVQITPSLRLVPSGPIDMSGDAGSANLRIRDAFPESFIVVDAGTLRSKRDVFASIAAGADHSLAVVRPCYLAAQRLLKCDVPRDGIVVVEEPGRVLSTKDVREVLGNVATTVPFDPAVARSVDAGRIARRLPRSARAVEKFVAELVSREKQPAKEVQRAS